MDSDLLKAGMFDGLDPVKPATSATPKNIQSDSSFRVSVPDTIDSSVLSDGTSIADVIARRNQLAKQQANNLDNFDPAVTPVNPFNNPEQYILSALYGDREKTVAERGLEKTRKSISSITSGIEDDLTDAQTTAEQTTAFSEKDKALADTNEKIAQRTAQFRRELRAFESSAERRGVAREAYTDEKTKLEADATAELADLYIIQNAQQGNLEAARDYIDTAVNNRYRSIQIELQQKQAELADYISTVEGEEKVRAQQLQLALNERERNLQYEREDAKTKRELALQAAANGASQSTISAITNAENVDVALTAASPYIGLLDRQIKQQQYYNSVISGRKAAIELDLLENPPAEGVVDSGTLKKINDLSDGQRKDLNNARQTVAEIDRMIELVSSVGDISLLTKATEEGREFNRLADNVADKLARERTGAVVGKEEEKTFKRILGVGFFNQIASSDEEVIGALNNMKGIHTSNISLIDPTGDINTWLDSRTLKLSNDDNQEINAIWGVGESTPEFNVEQYYGSI